MCKARFFVLFLFFLWCLARIEGLLSKCFFSLLGSSFPGPLARESFCCGFFFRLCHLEFLIVSFFSIFGYTSQKENTGTHHCVFAWIPRSLFSLPSPYFSVLRLLYIQRPGFLVVVSGTIREKNAYFIPEMEVCLKITYFFLFNSPFYSLRSIFLHI